MPFRHTLVSAMNIFLFYVVSDLIYFFFSLINAKRDYVLIVHFCDNCRLCNMDIISHVQQVICFAFHDSKLLMETCQEAKNMRKIVTLFYLDWAAQISSVYTRYECNFDLFIINYHKIFNNDFPYWLSITWVAFSPWLLPSDSMEVAKRKKK